MLSKPPSCVGCALHTLGAGFMNPEGYPELGVTLMGEALGDVEAKEGRPFRGPAGVRLGKMIERAGFKREQFQILNAAWCQPPKNREPTPWEVAKCSQYWAPLLTLPATKVIVPMGNVPLSALTSEGGILSKRGYVDWSDTYSAFLLPTVHPSFIMRGNGPWEVSFVYDLRHAVEVARDGWTPIERDYLLDPAPLLAAGWVRDYLELRQLYPELALSYDLETPDKGDSEDDIDITLGYIPGKIDRCGYGYVHPRTGRTQVLSMVWDGSFWALHRALLESLGPKVVCPTPDQRVLTADLRWVRAGDLKVGDQLVSFDEDPQDGRKTRRFRTGTVTFAQEAVAETFRVTFEDGSCVTTTGEHQWLAHPRGKGSNRWITTRNLLGCRVSKIVEPWTEDTSKEAGYLAGFFDGEGHVSKRDKGALTVGACQNLGPTRTHVLKLLRAKGYRVADYADQQRRSARGFKLAGRINQKLRFLGSVRPLRLLKKATPDFFGSTQVHAPKLLVTKVELCGYQPIVQLSVDARTYILEGFLSHNCYRHFDNPRIAAHGVVIGGAKHDIQEMWHCLFAASPKSLEHMTPALCPRQPRWKHLNSGSTRAYYNGVDAGVEVESYYRLLELLHQSGCWEVYVRDVFGLNPLLLRMSAEGMPLDDATRADTSLKLSAISTGLQGKLNDIAKDVKPVKIYAKFREGLETTTIQKVEAYCSECGKKANVKHPHFKCGTAEGEVPLGERLERTLEAIGYVQPLDFTPSNKGLLNYANAKGYRLITRWDKESQSRKTPMDETAVRLYALRHPEDTLWPVVLEDREVGKLLSTYVGQLIDGKWVGGLRVNPKTGRTHTTFKHDPSTLRLSSAGPNMQNIPRGSTILGKLIRKMFKARDGRVFWKRDFSGIEAVLVGFFANAPRIIRIFKLDGHSFFTAYALYELNKDHSGLTLADLPQESWSDADLRECLRGIKKRFGETREHNKKVTHGANYRETAAMAQIILLNELGILYPVKDISRVMEFYHELFPEIRRWHKTVVAQVAGAPLDIPPQAWGFKARNCVITSPFGFPNRYYDTIRWTKQPSGWDWEMADESKSLISFLPQHSARIILTRAAQRIAEHPDPIYQITAQAMRLFIHDEILLECPVEYGDQCSEVLRVEMERPVPELLMPDGSALQLGTEAKSGSCWGDMQ